MAGWARSFLMFTLYSLGAYDSRRTDQGEILSLYMLCNHRLYLLPSNAIQHSIFQDSRSAWSRPQRCQLAGGCLGRREGLFLSFTTTLWHRGAILSQMPIASDHTLMGHNECNCLKFIISVSPLQYSSTTRNTTRTSVLLSHL